MRGEELLLHLGNWTLLQFSRHISNYLGADSLDRLLLILTRPTSRVVNCGIVRSGNLSLCRRGFCSHKRSSKNWVPCILLMMRVVGLRRSVGDRIVTLTLRTAILSMVFYFEAVVGNLGHMSFSRTYNLTTALSRLNSL